MTDKTTRASGTAQKDWDSPRILFLGNSITLHAPKTDIGWKGNWGMAASCAERDYVHLLMDKIRWEAPQSSHRIGQLADWEREYWRGTDVLNKYAQLKAWNADVVVVRLGDNIDGASMEDHDLFAAFVQMIDFFVQGKAKVALTTCFYVHPPKDELIFRLGKALDCPVVDLAPIAADDSMKALGDFAHSGVASHPGDLGMEAIADALYPVVRRLTLS